MKNDTEESACPVKEMSEMSLGENNGETTSAQKTILRASKFGEGQVAPSPRRRVERNKSGPLGRNRVNRSASGRAPPRRSQSSKIGRPAFNPDGSAQTGLPQPQPGKRRGVNRSHSNNVRGTARNVPARTGSFQRRRVPDRTSSSNSLRRAHAKASTNNTVDTDDVSVSDSVFTSFSIQTMDSIMVRKKQRPPGEENDRVNGRLSIVFDDSVNDIGRPDSDDDVVYEYEEDMSVFSESWGSESCDVLSDYEEGEMDGAILEDDEGEDGNERSTSLKTEEIGCTSAE